MLTHLKYSTYNTITCCIWETHLLSTTDAKHIGFTMFSYWHAPNAKLDDQRYGVFKSCLKDCIHEFSTHGRQHNGIITRKKHADLHLALSFRVVGISVRKHGGISGWNVCSWLYLNVSLSYFYLSCVWDRNTWYHDNHLSFNQNK